MLRSNRHSGFTLIELMVVLAIIAIIAGIAIPNLVAARSNANEKAIVATLRSIMTAQELARTHGLVDMDHDGAGEGASLPELAGGASLRGTQASIRPPYISAGLGNADTDGMVMSHGYYFAMYLPDSAGTGVLATPTTYGQIDTNLSETYWTCIAWPSNKSVQGGSTFFINQSGDLLTSKEAQYSGKTSVPPAGCALLGVGPTAINSSSSAVSQRGADGNLWVPVN